ncbi:MAG: DUF7713 domain-containing protein [Egibacteraceae bacterium]
MIWSESLCTECGAGDARISLDGVLLCDRCADRRIAAATGLPELPDPPEAEKLTGPDDRGHHLRYRLWRAPSGIIAEVEEESDPGYAACVVADHHHDPDLVAHTLRAKIHDEISRCYLERDPSGDGWIVEGSEVWGRLAEDAGGAGPAVIVDGRKLTWQEFGAAVMPLVGWEFRIMFGQSSWPPPDAERDDAAEWDDDDWLDEDDAVAWEVPVAEAAGVLQAALAEWRGAPPPSEQAAVAAARLRVGLDSGVDAHGPMRWAAGFDATLPADDVALLLRAVAGVVNARPTDPDEPWTEEFDDDMLLDDPFGVAEIGFEDWLGAVIGLVRAGPGAWADPQTLVEYVEACPEAGRHVGDDEAWLLEGAFSRVTPVWEAAGLVDSQQRLTPLGAWILPRALAHAWGVDFDVSAPTR